MAQRLRATVTVLDTAGAAPDGLSPSWQAVRAYWRQERLLTEQSRARMEEVGDRFVRRLQASGITDWAAVDARACAGFVSAPTASGPARPGTQHLRRSTVRAIFRALRELGGADGDPTLDLRLPPRSPLAHRPLTDDEVVLCRASSRMGTTGARTLLRATAWALGEATAASSEIGAVRLGDLDDPRAPTRVRLPTSRRYDGRDGELTEWGSAVLARQAAALLQLGADPDTLLAYAGAGTGGAYLAQASVCAGIGRVLELAGLREDPGVRPGSVRGWAGRRLHRSGLPLEKVASRLGCRSLDAAAAEIGLRWRLDGTR
jgi:hypothetical protein